MTLDKKVQIIHRWSKPETLACLARFKELYTSPKHHYAAIHHAAITGEVDKYIELESRRFARYARQWAYYRCVEQKEQKTKYKGWGV